MPQEKFGEMSNYAYLRQALCKAYPALNNIGENSLFQFVASPLNASWESGDEFSLYDLMDTVPADRNAYYTPGTGRVSSAYEDLIGHISKNNCYNNDDWQRMYRDLETQKKVINSKYTDLQTAYMKATHKTTVDENEFVEWANKQVGPFGNPKAKAYLEEYKKIQSYQEQLDRQEKDINEPIFKLKDAYKNSLKEYTTTNGTFSLPAYNVSESLADLESEWAKYGDDEYAETVKINTREEIKEPWISTFSKSVEKVWLMAHAQGSTDLSQTLSDVKYEMTLKLKGISTFTIARPQWYKASYVDPHIKLAKGMALDKESFFGQKGTLHLIPTSFLVIYRPTIELKVNKDVYQTHLSTKAYANNMLAMFGFGFGFKGSMDKHLVSKGDTCTLRFDPPANDRPKIVGVTSVKNYL